MKIASNVITLTVVALAIVSVSSKTTSVSLTQPLLLQEKRVKSQSDIKIELVPKDFTGQQEETKAFEFSEKARFKVVATNTTSVPLRVRRLQVYYQNRPQLFKGDRLIPYRDEITKLINLRDTDPTFVRMGSSKSLSPGVPIDLDILNLTDWYGPLQPGTYRITNRHRFDIGGQWSLISNEVHFVVLAPQ
jgi:hypothetical protein